MEEKIYWTFKETIEDEYGNIRSDEHGYIKRSDVFVFAAKAVQLDIKRTLDFAESSVDNVSFFLDIINFWLIFLKVIKREGIITGENMTIKPFTCSFKKTTYE